MFYEILPYTLLIIPVGYIVYLFGRKTCAECPHPEKRLCFSTCEEFNEGEL